MSNFVSVTSGNNPQFKYWTSLLKRKYRDKEEAFILEGELLILEAFRTGNEILDLVFSSHYEDPESFLNEMGKSKEGEGIKVFTLSSELFGKISQTENGREVFAVIKKPNWSIDDLAALGDRFGSVIILDRIQDPGNVGTVIRTADAGGYSGILAIKGTADVFSPKVIRSAAGSVLRMPMVFVDSEEEAVKFARKMGLKLTVTHLKGEKDYWEEDLREAIGLVIGNEGSGVSDYLVQEADSVIKIPMTGDIDSLNAGIACAVIVYESVRQRNNK